MIIYKTTNSINGKVYIGKDSKNKKSYYGGGILLKKAIKKYGKKNFKKEIIEFCKSKDHLNEREIYWVNFYKKLLGKDGCYNIADGGIGGNNNPHDNPNWPEIKQKLIISLNKARLYIPKGKDHPYFGKKSPSSGIKWTEESKEKLKESLKNSEKFQLNVHSKERAEKISLAQKGKKCPNRAKFGEKNSMYGKKHTDESKRKTSESIKKSEKFKQAMLSEERSKKISLINTGRKISEETRLKISGNKNHMFGKTHTPENKKKMSFPLEKNPRAQCVILENKNNNTFKEFGCIKLLAEYLNKPRSTVNMWVTQKKEIESNIFIYYKEQNGNK